MSGGVDSSVAAALLKEQGYDVVGVYLKNWSDDRFSDCPWEKDWADVQAVGKKLDIPVVSWNFEREYRARVIEYFFREYAAGRTPNPDVMCNKEIKFGLFLTHALKARADHVATGHYARIVERENEITREREKFLAIPKDTHKDQTYFLYTLTHNQLQHVLFPLADLTKEGVRAKAKELGLPTADRPDSQGICFVGEVNLVNFLKSRLPEKVGAIETIDGETIGEHRGVWFSTIGQRHGLGIGGGIPYYVVDKDVATNTLIVAAGSDHPALYSREMVVEEVEWRGRVNEFTRERVNVRIRHGGPLVVATIKAFHSSTHPSSSRQLKVFFAEPQRAVTPGQVAVFYKGGTVLGGGIIAPTSVRPRRSLRSPRRGLVRVR